MASEAAGARGRLRLDLGQRLPDGPQRRGKRVSLIAEFVAGIGDQAVDFLVGQVEGHTSYFVQNRRTCKPAMMQSGQRAVGYG